jgi:hypothetical protein
MNPISLGNSVDLGRFSEISKKRDPVPKGTAPQKGQKWPISCGKYLLLGDNLAQNRALLGQCKQKRAQKRLL